MMKRGSLFLFFTICLTWNESRACFSSSTNDSIPFLEPNSRFFKGCDCTEPGYTIDNIQWFDNHDNPIGPQRPGTKDNMYIERIEGCCVNLFIHSFSKGLSGSYKCVTNFEGTRYEKVYNIQTEELTDIINTPETQNLLLDAELALIQCEIHMDPLVNPLDIVLSWKKMDGANFIPIESNDRYNITPEGLYIVNVTMEDGGIYNCSALNTNIGDIHAKQINVKIVTKPNITSLAAISTNTPIAGDTLTIECLADGIPKVEYTIKKVDEAANVSRWINSYNKIIIDKVEPTDSGKYICIAKNECGEDIEDINIQVKFPPTITFFPNMTAKEDEELKFDCKANGFPQPNVSITFVDTGAAINEEFGFNLFKENVIVRPDYYGTYICNATNEVGSVTQSMFLDVQYKPHFDTVDETIWGWDGKIANLSCTFNSNPPSNLIWSYQGNEIIEVNQKLLTPLNDIDATYITSNGSSYPYGQYECTANNSIGVSKKTIKYIEGHLPPIISNVTLNSTEHTSVTFDIDLQAFTAFEGPSILGFTAEYDKEELYNVTHIHINRTWSVDRSCTIDGLEPNTTYLVRFAAINDVGTGTWSEFIEFQTLQPSTPSAPVWEIDSVTVNITDMNQEIKWAPSADNGAPVQHYVLSYCIDDKSCNDVKIGVNESLKIDNSRMIYNTTNIVCLWAHNVVGDSLSSCLIIDMLAETLPPTSLLSAGALIGLSIVVVFICLLLLDLLLLVWRRQGIIANCCIKKKKKSKAEETLHTRDKKGLLKDNREPEESLRRPDNRHKEFEYNKTTGIITGRHSAV